MRSIDDASDKSTEPIVEDEEIEKGWWFNSDDRTFKGTNRNGPAFGFDESLRFVEDAWQTNGPFHGILGFSQGACFVGLICSLAMRSSKLNKITLLQNYDFCFHFFELIQIFALHFSDQN